MAYPLKKSDREEKVRGPARVIHFPTWRIASRAAEEHGKTERLAMATMIAATLFLTGYLLWVFSTAAYVMTP